MRTKAWICGFAMIGILFALSEVSGQQDQKDPEQSRIQRGFSIAPVPLKLRNRNRALVGLGSYIVNAQGGCNDCHTNPPYAGWRRPLPGPAGADQHRPYLAGGTPFGPFISRNITPDEDGLPRA